MCLNQWTEIVFIRSSTSEAVLHKLDSGDPTIISTEIAKLIELFSNTNKKLIITCW